MRYRLLILTGLLLFWVLFATLGPPHLWPAFGHPFLERLLAWMVLGATVALSAPDHRGLAFLTVVAGAGLSEAAQVFVAPRHAAVADAVAKMAGAALGVGFGLVIEAVLVRRLRRIDPLRRRLGRRVRS